MASSTTAFKCDTCGALWRSQKAAEGCEYEHVRLQKQKDCPHLEEKRTYESHKDVRGLKITMECWACGFEDSIIIDEVDSKIAKALYEWKYRQWCCNPQRLTD
jgi:predicted RNA-binding Zn-ribbon protein involved in translation (DUF1610 family)